MNAIHLISGATLGKPATVVYGDCEGIRMREPMERVHYREDEDDLICIKCGQPALVWHANEDRWAVHAMRCV